MQISFRKRSIIAFIILFLIFCGLILLIAPWSVNQLILHNLKNRASLIVNSATKEATLQQMVQKISTLSNYTYYRLTLYSEDHLIFDSRPSAKTEFIPYELKDQLDGKKFSLENPQYLYVNVFFDFLNNPYELRASLPYEYAMILFHQLELVVMGISFVLLLFFSFLSWGILETLSSPMRRVIEGIRPYQSGKMETIPDLYLGKLGKYSEFQELANTLTSLSMKVKSKLIDLTREKNEKEAILESLSEGIIAIDASMIITYANFSASRMLGISKKLLIGRELTSFEQTDLLKKCVEILSSALENHTYVSDSFSSSNRKKLHLDLIAAPIPYEKRAILVLQDNSNHYRVLEMGKDFVANASHELRTPITIIRGFAETLHDMPDLSKQMLEEITEKIVRNCHRMDTLVKNLLTLADLENLPLSKSLDCNVCDIVDNCKHLLLIIHPEIEIEVFKEKLAFIVRGSPDLLELAFMNLLENAVKYSHPPAHLTISLKELDEEVEITFQDKGIGIPPQDIEHIFERFYTVNKARSRKLGGAGLGLSIVKTVIEKHDGKISVESVLGEGTTFTIILPLSQKARPRITPS